MALVTTSKALVTTSFLLLVGLSVFQGDGSRLAHWAILSTRPSAGQQKRCGGEHKCSVAKLDGSATRGFSHRSFSVAR